MKNVEVKILEEEFIDGLKKVDAKCSFLIRNEIILLIRNINKLESAKEEDDLEMHVNRQIKDRSHSVGMGREQKGQVATTIFNKKESCENSSLKTSVFEDALQAFKIDRLKNKLYDMKQRHNFNKFLNEFRMLEIAIQIGDPTWRESEAVFAFKRALKPKAQFELGRARITRLHDAYELIALFEEYLNKERLERKKQKQINQRRAFNPYN